MMSQTVRRARAQRRVPRDCPGAARRNAGAEDADHPRGAVDDEARRLPMRRARTASGWSTRYSSPPTRPDKAVSDLWLRAGRRPQAAAPHYQHQAPPKAVSRGRPTVSASPSRPSARPTKSSRSTFSISPAGGEARRLTNLSTGAVSPKWRPDGKAILFESLVYPNALDDEANKKIAAERKARKYNVRAYEHFPIRYWNQWLDDRQPTLMVQSIEPGASAQDILSSTALARTPGFSGSPKPTPASHLRRSGVPTAGRLCSRRPPSAGTPRSRMWAITCTGWPREGGEPRVAEPGAGDIPRGRIQPRRQVALLQVRAAG